ncbi:MAG TPA: FecR domain-containing protein, partial [Tepidisphaeraceae bacterium]|nr:FecR domain-containing protein [Tepidisphaeraceae bacterium]
LLTTVSAGYAEMAAPSNDATQPIIAESPTTEPISATIMEIKGHVQARLTRDGQWVAAKEQMVLPEGAEIRTGPKSSVTFVIPPDQTITLDRLGTLEIIRSNFENGKIMTDLGMKYGRTNYDIEAHGQAHDAKVHSPGAVLAIRGTHVSLYDQPPFTPQAESFTGRAMFGYAKRFVPVGSKGGSYAKITAGSSGAADTSLQESVIDPRSSLALTATDQQLINQQVSRGAVLSFDPIANIDVIKGGAGPLPDSTFAQNPPGPVDFYLRWKGNADLNLTVTLQKGDATSIVFSFAFNPSEFLYPGFGLNNTASGGHIAFDHRGGPNGGEEIAFWPKLIPGLYGLSAQSISGATANFTFNAVVNGKAENVFAFADDGSVVKSKQLARTILPGEQIVGLVAIPDSPTLDSIALDDPGSTPQAQSASVASSAAKTSKSTSKSTISKTATVTPNRAMSVKPLAVTGVIAKK